MDRVRRTPSIRRTPTPGRSLGLGELGPRNSSSVDAAVEDLPWRPSWTPRYMINRGVHSEEIAQTEMT